MKGKDDINEKSRWRLSRYQNDKLLNFASTTLVFVNKQTKKPVNCPNILKEKLLNTSHEK